VGSIAEIVDSDIVSDNSQSVGAVKDLKLNDKCGNVIENKGPGLNAEL
jgi:sporulation protein YlmC with PRC-barrel domain